MREVRGRRGRRSRKLLDGLKERRGYSHLKEDALDRTMWRACFGRGFGPVVRQTEASLSCSIVWVVFFTLCPSVGPKERSRQALDRLPLVSNFLTNFWIEHVDGARLSPNSVRNAVWHALNEPVCQYLRMRNPRCSTVYIDNSLGPLARDSPCVIGSVTAMHN